MYGQKLLEVVQGPGEVLFLPQGLTHCILNLQDNVAYTENYLYIGGLPGKYQINQQITFCPFHCDITRYEVFCSKSRDINPFFFTFLNTICFQN
jgi:hypothetical protein